MNDGYLWIALCYLTALAGAIALAGLGPDGWREPSKWTAITLLTAGAGALVWLLATQRKRRVDLPYHLDDDRRAGHEATDAAAEDATRELDEAGEAIDAADEKARGYWAGGTLGEDMAARLRREREGGE